jgi:trk system potassium uptake protein
MHYRSIINQFGLLLIVLSAIMFTMVAAFYTTQVFVDRPAVPGARGALIVSGAVGMVLGGGLWLLTRRLHPHIAEPGLARTGEIGRREAFLLVGLTWLLGAGFAALPYCLWANFTDGVPGGHPFRSYVNCYFEAMSGLTTAGSSILSDIESVPRSLLLWRALTQWLGGLGIVVLFVAVLPTLGVGGKKLVRAEAGLTKEGVQPHIRDTARILWLVYVTLSTAQILTLRVWGMPWYDSFAHTFTTMATGGFSPKNASVGDYNSAAIQMTIVAFMVLGAVNFNLYFHMVRGRVRESLKDTELRVFLVMLAVAAMLVIGSVYAAGRPIVLTNGEQASASFGNAVRYGLFQTVSRSTTTGYATADDNHWPVLAYIALITVMFVGGCAGSTSAGIKVIRIWIMLKILLAEIERSFRPNVVRPLRAGRIVVDQDVRIGTLAFILSVMVIFGAGSAGIMLLEQANPAAQIDFKTAATATLGNFTTVGPGFGLVGATGNYGWMTAPSKLLLCLIMVLGRLEVFAIVVLLTPRFWKPD